MSAYGTFFTVSERTVKAVQKNHPDEFTGALRDIEAVRADTGLPFSADEMRRLATLAVLQAKGLFTESTPALVAQFTNKEVQPA